MRTQMEIEEELLEEQYANGEISDAEYRREMQELQRDYTAQAEESAQLAYDEEMERW